MKKILVSSLITLTIFLSGLVLSTFAQEVVLCLSEADQYVVTVNEKGDCLEDENQTVLGGPGIEAKKTMTPVAKFKPNEECDGKGTITEIGFDENGNDKLDANEIVSSSATCSPTVAENEG